MKLCSSSVPQTLAFIPMGIKPPPKLLLDRSDLLRGKHPAPYPRGPSGLRNVPGLKQGCGICGPLGQGGQTPSEEVSLVKVPKEGLGKPFVEGYNFMPKTVGLADPLHMLGHGFKRTLV